MDKWFKDILPDKDPYHNRGRDQMRKKRGGSGIRVPVVKFIMTVNMYMTCDKTNRGHDHLILWMDRLKKICLPP
jgi:hypothetical protein